MFKIGSFITRVLSVGAYPPRQWRFRIAAGLVLVAMIWPINQYLRIVLRNPQRTGILVIGSGYGTPWDINPWCEENVAALERLDKHNLSLRRLSNPSLMVSGQWAELEDDVEHLVENSPAQQPLIVYINLHGIAAIDGQPYMLVRDSQPLDSSTWLPLDRLVQRIRQALPHPRQVVLAIEGGRQHALPLPNHPEQSFADSVRRWYTSLQSSGQASDLSIILSSSSRFGSVEHSGLAGDLFTTCLAEALSGQCDQPDYGGDGDQQVELGELTRYVHQQVEQRSRQVRAVPQVTEQLIAADAPRFLAWSTSLQTTALFAPPVNEPEPRQVESLTELWKRIYAIQAAQPWREDPHAWGRLKRTMVAWEQSIFGGSGARTQATEFASEAERWLAQLETITSQRERNLELEVRLARRAALLWQQLSETPSLVAARQIVQAEENVESQDDLSAMPMLRQLIDQPQLQIWSQADLLQRWCQLRSQLERSRQLQSQTPCLNELLELESQSDSLLRELEDGMLADALDEAWHTKMMTLAAQVNRWQSKCEQVQEAVRFNEQMLARLPMICDVIDMLDAQPGSNEPLSPQLDELERAIEANRQRLSRAAREATPFDELATANELAQQLFGHIAHRWQRLVYDSQTDCATDVMPLEIMLNSGLLPIEIGSIDKAVQLRLTSHKRLSHSQALPSALDHANQTPAVETGIHNRERLLRWLAWSNDQFDDTRAEREPSWDRMHTARVRACFGIDASLTEPVARWQARQVRLRRVATGRRVLDDFWKHPQLAGQDYFVAASQRFLAGCSENERNQLDGLLQLRRAAAFDGFQLDCECRPVWNEQTSRLSACKIMQSRAGPPGIASLQAVQLNRAHSFEPLSRLIPVPVGRESQSQTLQIPMLSPNPATATSNSVARLVFRGHVYSSPFELQPPIGSSTIGVTTSAGPARLTVQSTAQRQRVRLLILDCSSSMNQPQAAEGAFDASSPMQPPTRLDAARLALARILEHWRGGDDHVGVLLYGHRVALGTKEQGKLWQMKYMNRYPFPREIEAFEDVETVLPPGRFDDQEYSAVMERLQTVVPWGQTPLYLAIDQAARELERYQQAHNSNDPATPNLDVIVISDGRNYQFNPSPDKNVSLDAVIQRSQAAGIRVHVIGFGVETSELQQATDEFTRLANQTGGSVCMQLQTALQLAEHIDELTEPERFRVRLPDGQWVDSRCSEMINLPTLEKNNTPILVDYRHTSTLIPANAHATIRLAPGKDQLVRAQPALQSASRSSLSMSSGQISPFDVVLTAAQAPSHTVQWQLSLERRDALVAQRPRYLWVEVQAPLDSGAGTTTHVVCDPVWQTETTEPVLNFTTHDWPINALNGSVKIWCSDQLPEPLIRFQCDPASLSKQWISSEPQGESGHVQYQLQAETDGVTLVLWHSQAAEVLELMPLIENLPGGTRVDRRYQPHQRVSVHRFSHPDLLNLERLNVMIHSVSAFKAQALRSTTAIEVPTQREIASLPATVARP